MSNGVGGSGFCSGLIVGAALGAAAALLFAPRSGRELRDSMLAQGRGLREKAEGMAAELRDRSGEVYEKTRETLKQAADGMKDAGRALTRS